MRVLTTLLLFTALALSVYNTIEMRRMKAEVAGMRATAMAQASEKSARDARARELLQEAEAHSKRAQELMRKGDHDGAREEMQKSMDLMAEAAKEAEGVDLVSQIRESAGNTARRIEDLISRVRKKP